MINFKLKHIDKTQPAGTGEDQNMSWFWLTDSDLWLNIGDNILYEYTPEAIKYFGHKTSKYSDYPLVRFIEDFSILFEQINENIPEKIYNLTKNLNSFLNDTLSWLDIYETDEDEYSDFYFEEYDNLISWIYNRNLNSGHLIGGPSIFFFRSEDKIRIVWKTEYEIEDGIQLWTAKDGSLEISFVDFINKIKKFGKQFFEQMSIQVNNAVEKNWKKINIDKIRLVQEHSEREKEFYQQLQLLEQKAFSKTDWNKINELNTRMNKELKTKA